MKCEVVVEKYEYYCLRNRPANPNVVRPLGSNVANKGMVTSWNNGQDDIYDPNDQHNQDDLYDRDNLDDHNYLDDLNNLHDLDDQITVSFADNWPYGMF